jgi:S1-C subfamily serine protease
MDTSNGAHDTTPERDENAAGDGTGTEQVRGGDTTPIAPGQPAQQAQPTQPTAPLPQGQPAHPQQAQQAHPAQPSGWNPYGQAPHGYPQQPYQGGGYPAASGQNQNPYAAPGQSQGYPAGAAHAGAPYGGSNPYAAPGRDAFGVPQGAGQANSGHAGDGQPPYGGFPPNGAPQYMWAPPQQTPATRRRRRAIALIAGAFATAAVFGVATSFGIAAATGEFGSMTNSSSQGSSSQGSGSSGFGSGGLGGFGGSGSGGSESEGGSGNGSATSGTLPSASSAQEVGVVDVVSQLTYDSAESAGTGLVLTSNGEILTNNHVIEDSTSISVTVVSTGRTYTAKVVGTDETDDIAVLQLQDASGLTKANINSSAKAAVGEAVTGVGNAGGTGGTPSAAAGTVVATNQTITTQAEEAAKSETLHGLIETNADIQAGDSGGPLYNSSNQVIGIDTAASEGTSQTQGYAIPISSALTLASEIEAGDASSTIVIGYPAFLGVEVAASSTSGSAGSEGQAGGFGEGGQAGGLGGFGEGGQAGGLGEGDGGTGGQASTVSGAAVEQVISGTPAESAGIEAGDTITAVNGTTIDSSAALSSALANYKPGQKVTITWVDASGASQSATVTLTQGPAA